jgi:predicted thioesterase
MVLTVKVGAEKERNITTNSNQSTDFLWKGENVLSTPSLVSEIEETCRLLLREQFIPDVDWNSVGTFVEIKHLALTPVGAELFLKAKVVSVNGRRVMFDVEASDRIEKVGEGRHERFIINIHKFRSAFNEKQKQLKINYNV